VRSKLLLLPAAFALVCGIASAQTTQKFAVIDFQKALLSTKDGQKAVEELKTKFGPKETEFQKRQSDLQAKQDEYRKKENTLSEDAKASLAREIDTMTKNLQRDTDDTRQDVDAEQQRLISELGGKMMQVLNKYSVDKGLTMVFDVSGQSSNILFAASATDITADIVKLYDTAAPSTPSAPPSASSAPKPTTTAPAASSAPKPTTTAPRATTPAPRPATPAK
jgi:outer membrane protein